MVVIVVVIVVVVVVVVIVVVVVVAGTQGQREDGPNCSARETSSRLSETPFLYHDLLLPTINKIG